MGTRNEWQDRRLRLRWGHGKNPERSQKLNGSVEQEDGVDTGGKGQYTQWVHCELIVGSETICPAHIQWINSGHFQKVPTHLSSPNPAGKSGHS